MADDVPAAWLEAGGLALWDRQYGRNQPHGFSASLWENTTEEVRERFRNHVLAVLAAVAPLIRAEERDACAKVADAEVDAMRAERDGASWRIGDVCANAVAAYDELREEWRAVPVALGQSPNQPPSTVALQAAAVCAELATLRARVETMHDALNQAEACMSIVAPRSNMAEYRRILGVVRAALKGAKP